MRSIRRAVNERARDQRGLVTRADLRDVGVTASQRRQLVAEGAIEPVGRRTFHLGGVPLDERARVLAAVMDTGGVASHRTAAWLHGLPGFVAGHRPEVLREGARVDHRSPIAHVHSTTWLTADDIIDIEGIPTTSVARTLFSLAACVPRELTLDQVRGAVDDAVRLHRASDRWLWWRLEKLRVRGRNGVSTFEAVLAARAGGLGTESWLERELLELLRRAQLPLPECQARIRARGAFLARVDFLYRREGIVIEVTGAVARSTPGQRAADARRRNDLLSQGLLVLEFTYEQVVGSPPR